MVEPTAAGTVCLVVDSGSRTGAHSSSGEWIIASHLARNGWTVHVLECGSRPSNGDTHTRGRNAGVRIHHLAGFAHLPDYPIWPLPGHLRKAANVRYVLEQLHRDHHLDLVQFQERGGLGFRTIQAQRTGQAFSDVATVVRLAGSTRWRRESERSWMWDVEELAIDYCERYSFDHATWQMSGSPDLLDHARSAGWQVREDAISAAPLQSDAGSTGSYEGDLITFYVSCVAAVRRERSRPKAQDDASLPLVTVAVPHYNLADFLPATLESLSRQTYPRLEVLVMDDGSTDPEAVRMFEQQRERYPEFRFTTQNNCGLSETRNQALLLATGEYFIPVDADNLAAPHMVEVFVRGMQRRPELSALTCFNLGFRTDRDLQRRRFLYDAQPAGGPHVMGCLGNVYGDSNAIFRTADLRSLGGYETVPGCTCEDWEVFVKLHSCGLRMDVVPEHLFFYRVRDDSLLRTTNEYANHQRILRHYVRGAFTRDGEMAALLTAFVSMYRRQGLLRYSIIDRLHAFSARFPAMHSALIRLAVLGTAVRRRFRRTGRVRYRELPLIADTVERL